LLDDLHAARAELAAGEDPTRAVIAEDADLTEHGEGLQHRPIVLSRPPGEPRYQRAAGLEDAPYADVVQRIEAGRWLDLGAGEQQTPALAMLAADHQGNEGVEQVVQ
jgi:hypothetical protein